MPGKYISLETACRHVACNDAACGAVLARLLFWQPKARIKRNGMRWIADVRKVWAYDCGLTVKSFDLALARLVKMGLVEKMQGPHPSGRALNSLYLRVTVDAVKAVYEKKNQGVPVDLLKLPDI